MTKVIRRSAASTMGELRLSERRSYTQEEADCMLTPCQYHLRRYLADNVANDEKG